jgi:hypothetical protein
MARKQPELPAKFVQILEYMDGPQAVLLERSADFKIVGVAIDEPIGQHSFFGSAISYDQWERYRRGMLDLRFLFMFPRWKQWFVFKLAFNKDGTIDLRRVARDEHAEQHYIPDAGFFSYDHSEPIKFTRTERYWTFKYVTDGVWDLPDFTEFYHKLTDIYVFSLALKKYQSDDILLTDKKRIRESFMGHPLRGGSSYINLYNDLASTQRLDERLSVGRLQYSSPGHVDVRGRLDIFTDLRTTFHKFDREYEQLKSDYKILHEFLRQHKLLSMDADKFEYDDPLARHIEETSRKLAYRFSLAGDELIFEMTDKNALKFAKVVLSYFRRVERYFMFFAEGRIRESEIVEG